MSFAVAAGASIYTLAMRSKKQDEVRVKSAQVMEISTQTMHLSTGENKDKPEAKVRLEDLKKEENRLQRELELARAQEQAYAEWDKREIANVKEAVKLFGTFKD